MKTKPGWPSWFGWLIGYTIIDLLLEFAIRGSLGWSQLPESISGAIFAATITWLFALRKWSKSDSLY